MADVELLQVDHLDWPNAIINATRTSPPGSPSSGDRYIVASSPTGAWTGHATHIARWSGSSWDFQVPTNGRRVFNEATGAVWKFNGTSWGAYSPSNPLVVPGEGKLRLATLEGPTVNHGTEYTALDVDGEGYVEYLFMSINASTSSVRNADIRFRIYVDHEVTPSIDVSLSDLSCSRGMESHGGDGAATASYAAELSSYTSRFASVGTDHTLYFKAPFKTHVKIGFQNTNSSVNAILGGYVQYRLQSGLDWGRFGKLRTYNVNAVSVAPYDFAPILRVLPGSANPGALVGVYLYMRGGSGNYFYLEGNMVAFIDGDLAFYFDSIEDYFGFGWYFWQATATRNVISPHHGVTFKDDTATVGTYRWHLRDPIPWEDSIDFTWTNGYIGIPFANNTVISGVVWYYTEH